MPTRSLTTLPTPPDPDPPGEEEEELEELDAEADESLLFDDEEEEDWSPAELPELPFDGPEDSWLVAALAFPVEEAAATGEEDSVEFEFEPEAESEPADSVEFLLDPVPDDEEEEEW